jgi:hypothetical protein
MKKVYLFILAMSLMSITETVYAIEFGKLTKDIMYKLNINRENTIRWLVCY